MALDLFACIAQINVFEKKYLLFVNECYKNGTKAFFSIFLQKTI